MNTNVLHLIVEWHKPRWYHWNRYKRGVIIEKYGSFTAVSIDSIHRKDNGQVRISTSEPGWPLDGAIVSINAGKFITLKGRGRRGRLHIYNP